MIGTRKLSALMICTCTPPMYYVAGSAASGCFLTFAEGHCCCATKLAFPGAQIERGRRAFSSVAHAFAGQDSLWAVYLGSASALSHLQQAWHRAIVHGIQHCVGGCARCHVVCAARWLYACLLSLVRMLLFASTKPLKQELCKVKPPPEGREVQVFSPAERHALLLFDNY